MDDHTDIVEYLRRNAVFNYKDTYIAAADEIERLRKELDTRIAMCDMRSEKIIELTNERDGARRELCAAKRELCRNEAIIRLQRHRVHRDSEDVVGLAKEIAVERGWDCFKDNP